MEILPKLTRFRINGLEISSFYTLDNVLDKEKENIFQTPQGTVNWSVMKLLVKDSIECILNRIFVCNQKQKQQKRWNLKCIVHQKTHSFWNWIYTTSIEGFKCYITRVSSQEKCNFLWRGSQFETTFNL